VRGFASVSVTGGSGHGLTGEARGRAFRCVLSSGHIGLGDGAIGAGGDPSMPHQAPFSVFVYLYARDLSGNQAIVGDHGGGFLNGWTFRLVQGSGQLGFTRWGIADEPSSLNPTANAHNAIGISHDGTTNRFFLNGQFQNVSSGQPSAGAGPCTMMGDQATWVLDSSIYVAYVWARTLSDEEFTLLYQDPWLLVRPPDFVWSAAVAAAGGGGGSTRRVFVPAFMG
jgi:hypothetical protein